ncbi:unnamed protein product [Microthlaspi erraticum]|uniref:Pectinesterase inhibitor domain-containing protein n=1 Tax=Microthlaspi erraticum TaxID=1685480 RepID=A0A6D2JKT1_9BRAS|nr:unnamed protein product [Microthlaspi erraticum]
MKLYKAIFLIGITVCYTLCSVYNVQASDETISDVPAGAPAPAPDASLDEPSESPISAVPASAPGPTEADINIDFNSIDNIADLTPKFESVNNFYFSSMKIDTMAKDLCKGTDYNNECLAAILPDLQKRADEGKGGVERKDVLRMEVESLSKKANATLDYAKRLMDDSKTTMPVKEAMSVCVESYESLIASVEDARTALDDGDYGRLESVLSAAISDVSTCSDTFVDIPGVESPTASLDELIKRLCSNVLAMSHKVQSR